MIDIVINCRNNIRILRLSKNMTQQELAKELHISRRTLDSYEHDRQMPLDVLVKYSNYFGVSTDSILKCPLENVCLQHLTTGQRIRYYRKLNKLSVKEFSTKLNKSYEYVIAYENDRRKPKVETLKQMANILNVTHFDLL